MQSHILLLTILRSLDKMVIVLINIPIITVIQSQKVREANNLTD